MHLDAVLRQETDDLFAQFRKDEVRHAAGEIADGVFYGGAGRGRVNFRDGLAQEARGDLRDMPSFTEGGEEKGEVAYRALGFREEYTLKPRSETHRPAEESAPRQQPAENQIIGKRHTFPGDLIGAGGGHDGRDLGGGGAVRGAGTAQGATIKLHRHLVGKGEARVQ